MQLDLGNKERPKAKVILFAQSGITHNIDLTMIETVK